MQLLPSLHDVPFALAGFEQAPVCMLHVPASWHWSCALQVIGFDPTHAPPWQVSVCVHGLASLHAVPLGWLAHAPQIIVMLAVVQPGIAQLPGSPLKKVSGLQIAWKRQPPPGSEKLTWPLASVVAKTIVLSSPWRRAFTVWFAIGWPAPFTTVTTTGAGIVIVAVVHPGTTHDPGAPLGNMTGPFRATNRYAPGFTDRSACPWASV
ncbi:MAG TPA: hypothetical protein VN903_26840 [Polyangia bacterium]|nr:hypothetical protein [Polyangia bacterium]